MPGQQLLLQWGPLRNSDLFSAIGLKTVFPLNLSGSNCMSQAREVLEQIIEPLG